MRRFFATAVLCAAAVSAQEFPAADLDRAIEEAIAGNQIPGAVLLVGHKGRVVHEKAYGSRALEPRKEPMTLDTIFDAASLTKVVATTPAIMKLFEQGKIRLNDPVTAYLPDFQGGSSGITVRHLLTHYSGLRPDVDLKPEWSGYETGIGLALIDKPRAAPGERFIYSDINFVLLAEIVRRITGETVADYVRKEVWEPLGMRETMFQPPAPLRPRIAPTERLPGQAAPLRGIVHDPTARFMGGVAGHAGMFTTVRDVARFADMMLGDGQRQGIRVFTPLTVEKFTSPQSPPDQPELRGLGWDIDTRFSSNRGELFPVGSFGHTGFTGTSLWIDPISDTYVILLANSVHPRLRPAISSLRSRVATTVAAAVGVRAPGVAITGYNETLVGARRTVARDGRVLTGLDVQVRDGFPALRGKRVGLVTNHTGIDREGRRNIDRMVEAGVRLVALYSPEHGIAGTLDTDEIANSKDRATGIPIFSLYQGPNRRPNERMLRDIDILVFDIQDIGARFYTYMCTMLNVMEEAAQRKIPFLVFDRPNPINGATVEGPVLDPDLESFIGCAPLPLRHGMTLGEIATMMNTERSTGATLEVVKMEGWERGDWFDSTGLVWVDPSPNMRSLTAAVVYPGVAMLESSKNYSVGRGTDSPFEVIGADWILGRDLAPYLNQRKIPGVRFYPVVFRPASSNLEGKRLEGVRLVVTDRDRLPSVRLGLEIAGAIEKLQPGQISFDVNERLIGNRAVIEALKSGKDPRLIAEEQQENLAAFLARRDQYLLYR